MSTISRDRDQSAESETALSAKRSAAKRRIQLYHQQLLKGCGNDVCTNEFCASSSKFCYKDLDSNSAATTAVELMKRHAPLCNDHLSKKTVTSSDAKCRPAPSPKETSPKAAVEIPNKSLASNKLPALTSSQASVVSPKSETVGAKRETASAGAEKSDSSVCLTEKRLLEVIDFCRQTGSWTDLNRYLGIFFRPEVLMSSFPVETPAIDMPANTSSKELMRSIEFDRDKDLDELDCVRLLPDNDDSSEKPSISTLTGASRLANSSQTTMDIESMRRSFTELYSIPDVPFQSLLVNAIVFLARTLETDLRSSNLLSRRDEYINLFLIVMEIPALGSPEFLEAALPQFCKTVGLLSDHIQARLARIWSTYDAQHLTTMVGSIQQLITVKVVSDYHSTETLKSVHDDDALTGAVKLLKILYYASVLGGRWDSTSGGSHTEADDDTAHNRMFDIDDDEELDGRALIARLMEGSRRRVNWVDPLPRILGINLVDSRQPLIPFDDFVNEPLSEIVEMDKDFINYRAVLDGEFAFSFMLHPFVLTPTVKHVAMYFDNRIRMMNERRAEILNRLIGEPVGTPHLKLSVRRDHLIDDALVNLEMFATDNPQALKKQLFVEFDGEQGIDEGGPSKEFFQLIIEELFNPDIGMFTYDEETHQFWFNSVSFETEAQYKLIGILLGLAIYNNVILDVHFPMVVYRKLMGRPGTFEDLKISHPTLARSLQQMLEYEGDVAADFMQPFCIGASDVFGHSHIHLLKENGDQIIVTNERTKEFVELYAEHLLNKSVDKQFSAFRHGFKMVTDESPLQLLFRPDEVELLICGSKNYDFVDLERSTQYDGGFTADSQTIKYFWETVHELSEEQKRQLLQFTTGSDRVPIGGLSQLKLVIARNGSDSDRLPTAHTCFNVLLLPEYESKAKLRDRLLKAITFFKGFGML